MKTKNIQMRLTQKTLSEIDRIKENTGVDNKTRIVISAISLLNCVCEEDKKGDNLYIEDKNGNKKQVLLLNL